MIIGSSGCGKSSAIRAGLIPLWRSAAWQVLPPIKPGTSILARLFTTFEPFFKGVHNQRQLSEFIHNDSNGLDQLATYLPEPKRYLLVVDQFEELFTLSPANECQRFIELLAQVAEKSPSRLAIVLAIRADFLESCLQHSALVQLIQTQAVYIPPLKEAERKQVIRTYAGTLDVGVEELRLPNRKKPNNCANLSFEVEIEHQVSFTKLDYCQYLLSSQTNYTLTNLADHLQVFSHDTINRYLRGEKLTPRLLWDNVEHLIQLDENGSIIFDDTVIDKNCSNSIELVRRQYSGTEHRVIRGIGLISCVYVNVKTGQFWVIDYRVYDPDGDGKTKLDHVADMLHSLVYSKQLPFARVLMDSWYAAQKLMALIEHLGKIYYCPLKRNRLVDDTGGVERYKQIEQLCWSREEQQQGKLIKIKNFPSHKKVKLFRVTVSTDRTDYIVTNDLSQNSTDEVQEANAVRWKIEEFHRGVKQLTGLEACQCRKARIQRNHIACAILAWTHLKRLAALTAQSIYQLKYQWLSDCLIEELKHPSIRMQLI